MRGGAVGLAIGLRAVGLAIRLRAVGLGIGFLSRIRPRLAGLGIRAALGLVGFTGLLAGLGAVAARCLTVRLILGVRLTRSLLTAISFGCVTGLNGILAGWLVVARAMASLFRPGFLLTTGRFVRASLPRLVRPRSSLCVALLAPALFLALRGGILILGAAALPIGRVARLIVALLGVGRVTRGLLISLRWGSRRFLIRLGLGLARRALVVGSLAALRVGPVRLVLALAVFAARRFTG